MGVMAEIQGFVARRKAAMTKAVGNDIRCAFAVHNIAMSIALSG